MIRLAVSLFVITLWLQYTAHSQDTFWELHTGATYTFRGPVTYSSGADVRTDTLVWTMKVEATARRGGVHAWLVSGVPIQLANYVPGAPVENHTIVRTGLQKYYLCSEEVYNRVVDSKDTLGDLAYDSECILDLPLTENKVFGEPEMIARNDGMYVWRVDKIWDSIVIPEGENPVMKKCYSVTYRALNSTIIMEWQDGMGPVRYYYHHNGSPGEFDMRCIGKNEN